MALDSNHKGPEFGSAATPRTFTRERTKERNTKLTPQAGAICVRHLNDFMDRLPAEAQPLFQKALTDREALPFIIDGNTIIYDATKNIMLKELSMETGNASCRFFRAMKEETQLLSQTAQLEMARSLNCMLLDAYKSYNDPELNKGPDCGRTGGC